MNLAKLAAFLGKPYRFHIKDIVRDLQGTEVPESVRSFLYVFDSELFYALLCRTAEEGLAVCTESVEKSWHTALYSEATGMISVVGPTPLDALVKAIEELPQGEPV